MSFKMLTPVDVQTKTFTTRRFREGYDTDEVDTVLDQVAYTITRFAGEIKALQHDNQKYKTIISQLKEQLNERTK